MATYEMKANIGGVDRTFVPHYCDADGQHRDVNLVVQGLENGRSQIVWERNPFRNVVAYNPQDTVVNFTSPNYETTLHIKGYLLAGSNDYIGIYIKIGTSVEVDTSYHGGHTEEYTYTVPASTNVEFKVTNATGRNDRSSASFQVTLNGDSWLDSFSTNDNHVQGFGLVPTRSLKDGEKIAFDSAYRYQYSDGFGIEYCRLVYTTSGKWQFFKSVQRNSDMLVERGYYKDPSTIPARDQRTYTKVGEVSGSETDQTITMTLNGAGLNNVAITLTRVKHIPDFVIQ